ncbi:hypothetical protein PVAP13_5NG228300 [Panicum virgatum]|uniref:Uncharacterized protein n=1 Tax=Panicum virgatum TaxID=38727 RepID=A0A8T0RWC1_PANVG|nr:hypothetical protein PVAP13_5NG228300 [Panicum virgatum]
MAIKFNTQRRAKWQRLKEQGARRMQAAITTIAAAPTDEAPADRRAGEQGRQMCSVVWVPGTGLGGQHHGRCARSVAAARALRTRLPPVVSVVSNSNLVQLSAKELLAQHFFSLIGLAQHWLLQLQLPSGVRAKSRCRCKYQSVHVQDGKTTSSLLVHSWKRKNARIKL